MAFINKNSNYTNVDKGFHSNKMLSVERPEHVLEFLFFGVKYV